MAAFALRRQGFEVEEAADAKSARVRLAERRPDLMLVDWMLPDFSGLELTRQIKRAESTADLPIIMLTARTAEGDKITGLESGADDYVTKPFSPRELMARINAVLRRGHARPGQNGLQAGVLRLDPVAHRVFVNEQELTLGPTEFSMLEFFIRNPERVFSRDQLSDRLWGGVTEVEERTVDVHIRRLRKALEFVKLDHWVQTVRGSGYRFSSRMS